MSTCCYNCAEQKDSFNVNYSYIDLERAIEKNNEDMIQNYIDNNVIPSNFCCWSTNNNKLEYIFNIYFSKHNFLLLRLLTRNNYLNINCNKLQNFISEKLYKSIIHGFKDLYVFLITFIKNHSDGNFAKKYYFNYIIKNKLCLYESIVNPIKFDIFNIDEIKTYPLFYKALINLISTKRNIFKIVNRLINLGIIKKEWLLFSDRFHNAMIINKSSCSDFLNIIIKFKMIPSKNCINYGLVYTIRKIFSSLVENNNLELVTKFVSNGYDVNNCFLSSFLHAEQREYNKLCVFLRDNGYGYENIGNLPQDVVLYIYSFL